MCRLFAQHADPLHLPHEPLCVARNALRVQSHRHRHGWGIGWYDQAGVQLRRGVMPAHADDAFVAAAREARSEIVVAHVRDASVGQVIEENTHPFRHERWLFAHNGTVSRFRRVAQVRRALEAEIDARYRPLVRGETDSERCFYAFLSRLDARVGAGGQPDLEDVRAALADTVATVVRLADRRPAKPSSLNLLVTNGEVLAVCRRGRTLHVAPHIATSGVFALASEPIGAGPWREVPEGGFVGIDPDHRILEAALATAASRRSRAA